MDIIYYLITFIFLILIIEITALVFKVTGLDIEKARFQVISILTHTGFTTRESEFIAQHPLRRKIASYLMVVSYFAQATFISIFFHIIKDRQTLYSFIWIVVIITFVLIYLLRNRYILAKFDSLIEKYISKQFIINKKHRTVEEVLKLDSDFGVYEIIIEEKSFLCGISLNEARLRDRYIQILNIDRGSHMITFPQADFIIQPADKLVVYGKMIEIKQFIQEQNTCNGNQPYES